MNNSTRDRSSDRSSKKLTKRFWRRADAPGGPSLGAALAPIGLLALFGYGALQTAPAMERQIEQRVRSVLEANGVRNFDVAADGQDVRIAVDGPPSARAPIEALAAATACDTWIAARLVCPASVQVEMTGTEPAPAAASRPPRQHDFELRKSSDGTLVLGGEVPSASVRDGIVASARAMSATVVDELVVTGETATDEFDWAIDRAWPALALISHGEVRWRDGTYSVTGATSATNVAALRRAFTSGVYADRLGALTVTEEPVADDCQTQLRDVLADSTIQFRTGSAEIAPSSEAVIDELARVAAGCSVALEVEGHTDDVGLAAMNEALSLARAQAVRQALMLRGVDGSRLSAHGYGARQPIADNSTAAGRARNRRIEINVNEGLEVPK